MTNKMRQGASGFYEYIPSLPQHVSANGCHPKGVVGALRTTQAVSVLWAYADYDPSNVASWPTVRSRDRLSSHKYKTHQYSVGRTYSCWMLNLLVHHVTSRL
jgi:hypothetical protein